MTFKPAHKHVGDKGKPGQVKLCGCKDREFSKCPGEWEPGCDLGANPKYVAVADERFLSEYIARKADDFDYFKPYQKKESKLTFDEWWKVYDGVGGYSNKGIAESSAKAIWEAALRNAPGAK